MALADIRKLIYLNPNIEMANKAQHRLGGLVRRSREYKKNKK